MLNTLFPKLQTRADGQSKEEIQEIQVQYLKEVICHINAKIDKYDPKDAIGSLLWFPLISSFTKLKLWRNVWNNTSTNNNYLIEEQNHCT